MRTLICLIAAFSLSGCALFNPRIAVNDGFKVPESSAPLRDLHAERERAFEYVRALDAAAGQHSELRTASALALIPLTGVALYKGITSDTANAGKLITKLTLTGAAIFGIGEQLYSPPRQRIYNEGMKAALCIIGTTEPYVLSAEQAAAFGEALSELATAIVEAEATGARIRYSLKDDRTDARKRVLAYLATTDAALAAARSIRSSGTELQASIDHAGNDLYRRIQALAVQVSEEVGKTEPDFASIKATLHSIAKALPAPATGTGTAAASATGSVPTALGAPNDDTAKAKLARLREELNLLDLEMQTVARYSALVNQQVQKSAAIAKVVEATPACSFAAPSTFRVYPAHARYEMKAGESLQLTVRGGTGAIRATLNGVQSPKLKVAAANKEGSNVVTLTVEAGAPAATAELLIGDATDGNLKSIEIAVVAPAPAPVPDAAEEPAAADAQATNIEATLSEADRKLVQKGVGLAGAAVDGILGDGTRAKIKAYKTANGISPADGTVTNALFKRVKAAQPPASLSASDIADIQAALKTRSFLAADAPAAAKLDAPAVVAAIKAYQKDKKQPETGVLTTAQIADLLS
jgi:peptidoglycan hydrolase-like protein with peptidoglycan-binding domain